MCRILIIFKKNNDPLKVINDLLFCYFLGGCYRATIGCVKQNTKTASFICKQKHTSLKLSKDAEKKLKLTYKM